MAKPKGRRFGGIPLSVLLLGILLTTDLQAQVSIYWLPSGLSYRSTTKGNIGLGVFNNGSLGGVLGMGGSGSYKGEYWVGFHGASLWFACLKEGRKLVSANQMIYYVPPRVPFYEKLKYSFVPGFVGDPKAGADTAFAGVGWKYHEDPSFIAYVSTDYNEKGIDVSGYNFPDWPIRSVDNKAKYIPDLIERSHYRPVYRSEQELFTIYKDTETDTDPEFQGRFANPDSFNIPIGIEVHQFCYGWSPSSGVLGDAVVFTFEIINKSGKPLHQCYAGSNLTAIIFSNGASIDLQRNARGFYSGDPSRNLAVRYNPDSMIVTSSSRYLQCLGLKVLQSPMDGTGRPLGMTIFKQLTRWGPWSSKARYDAIQEDPKINPFFVGDDSASYIYGDLHGTGPFELAAGDTTRLSTALLVAPGLDSLLLLDDMVKRSFDHDFLSPSPPALPTWSVTATDGGTIIRWDSVAEHSVDPIVPDSLGKPFLGYRLYRARQVKGPYLMIKEWQAGLDSIVHEYVDRGQDGKDSSLAGHGGLSNNISFYYKLTAYDEGAKALHLPSAETVSDVKSISLSGPASSPYALDNIRIVPNPYIVTHAAQQSIDHPKLFFNYLPEECTIRIYTVALELVAELHHHGGSAEEWDLRTQGGQQVASQLLIAQIETPQGTAVVKKFAVVLAE